MKILGLAALMIAFMIPAAGAQSGGGWDLSWSSIDGGGMRVTGGVYVVEGVIGQPDAGATMTGGGFTLEGGFLAVCACVKNANENWYLYE